MANLHFYYGVMSSSKSANLIIQAYNYRQNKTPYEVIKPSFDKRDATDAVVSRAIQNSEPAQALKNLKNYKPAENTKFILVDEVQFFATTDIDVLAQIADNREIVVICYGLMVDSNENIFPASRRLIEKGADLHQMSTNCQYENCTNSATHHLRFDGNNNVICAGQQFALGNSNYRSVCRKHFHLIYNGFLKYK